MKKILLVLALASASSANAIEPEIKLFAETPLRPIIHGVTNLPDGTELMLTLLRPASGYMGQSKIHVAAGQFASERFSAGGHPLNPGQYQVRIVMVMAELQPRAVQSIIGTHSERLAGPWVKPDTFGGPTFEYLTQIQLGGASDPGLDAQAKVASEQELRSWAVRSCRDMVDLESSGIGKQTPTSGALSAEQRSKKIDQCVAAINKGQPK